MRKEAVFCGSEKKNDFLLLVGSRLPTIFLYYWKNSTFDPVLVIYSVKRVIKSANPATAEVEEVQRAQYDKLEDTASKRIRQLKVIQL
jgi:hypothetical protein